MVGLYLRGLISWFERTSPATPAVTTDWLQERIAAGGDVPLVIDTRAPVEFQVSHIAGAINLDFQADDDAIRGEVAPRLEGWSLSFVKRSASLRTRTLHVLGGVREVVCYCSVGYRSSLLAYRINRLLGDRVKAYNLVGSVFLWAEEGKPLVDGRGNPTESVHPYNWFFGASISRSKWKWQP